MSHRERCDEGPPASLTTITVGISELNHGTLVVAGAICTAAGRAIARHPRRLTAVVAAVLLGAGSLSIASLAPEASRPEVSQVVESVEPLPVQAQIDELADHALRLYRSELTRSSDTADSLLKRLGINDPAAAAHLRSDAMARLALLSRAGRNVRVEASDDNHLLRLTARWSPDDDGTFKRLVVEKTDKGFLSSIETAPLVASSRLVSGVIQSSLFAATDESRIPDSVAIQVAEMFSGDIDFHRALRKGDRFSIVYETLEGDGEPLRSGRVLSSEFINNGKTLQAMWFQEPGVDKGAYYTLDGKSMRRSFLASPMEFSRVSSGFAMRFHPIRKEWRRHLGVDFASPKGTPVRTVGDGVVEFAGQQNGYGNVVFVAHRNQNTTVYAHLSRINVRRGQSVDQGQVVGLVGSTGMATGPHLHFEFRVKGVHHDPKTIAQNSEAIPVSAKAKPLFEREAGMARVQLAAATTIGQVTIE
jgi:murein DD-endopeptidase MepM/ murein hydrolase activator NlpD